MTNCEKQPICFTEVTLRDGMQQEDIKPVTIEQREQVFESLIDAGMEQLEVGHLGNEDGEDIAFTEHIIAKINEAEASGSERYKGKRLQVLVGSQPHLVGRAVAALEGFDRDRIVVHVYDRVSLFLRNLAANPYSISESAGRVFNVARMWHKHGFNHFSVSGEGASDVTVQPQDMFMFYASIVDALRQRGVGSINCNLAVTFGNSVSRHTPAILRYFNNGLKSGRDNVTTSIHPHNDHGSAVDYAIEAVRAGFDRIEGTMFGMGERFGNVAICDVVDRFVEDARMEIDTQDNGIAVPDTEEGDIPGSIWDARYIEPSVVAGMSTIFQTCVTVADIFGTHHRFDRTSLGFGHAYDAGSGPHAHANQEYLRDPIGNPLWRSYGSTALTHAMLGRPEALEVISVDPERIKRITINNHAAGNATRRVLGDVVEVAPVGIRQESQRIAQRNIDRIVDLVSAR